MSKILLASNVRKRQPNGAKLAVQHHICASLHSKQLSSNSRRNLQAQSGRFVRRSPAKLLTLFSNKKSRRAVLASLWKAACFNPTMSSSAWRILFPVFFSSRELSSMKRRSVTHFHRLGHAKWYYGFWFGPFPTQQAGGRFYSLCHYSSFQFKSDITTKN